MMKTTIQLSIDIKQKEYLKKENLSPTAILRDVLKDIMEKKLKVKENWRKNQ